MKKALNPITSLCVALAMVAAGPAFAATSTDPAKPAMMTGKLVRGSELIGAKVFDQSAKNIGDINDVLLDENTGNISHAVLSIGGFLGIGDKLTAVPWKFIKQSDKNPKEFVVDADKAKLTAGTSYDKSAWPDMNQDWFQKSYTSYGLTAKTGAKLVRASNVDDAKLFNEKGEQIGEIDRHVHPPVFRQGRLRGHLGRQIPEHGR